MNWILGSMFLLPLETMVNSALRSDPCSLKRISGLAGKVIEIESTLPPWHTSVLIVEDGVRLSGIATGSADAHVKGSSRNFVSLMLDSADGALAGTGIEIQGNAELVQDVMRVFQGLDVNWQGPFSSVFGDVITQGTEEFASSMARWTRQSSHRAAENLDEYLHEESCWLPSRPESESFNRRIDEIRLRLDRLAARLQQADSQTLAH